MFQNQKWVAAIIERIVAKQSYIEHFAHINIQSLLNFFASSAYFHIT
jgi:hypothetical protein